MWNNINYEIKQFLLNNGGQNNNDTASGILGYLTQVYPWYNWLVIVFDNTDSN